ncbi:MAG: ABC transporter substrate-binding protein [Chloroflexi bacterium]|nr:ABC transporter substrate-binding protein [Chloroflexota bacterium]
MKYRLARLISITTVLVLLLSGLSALAQDDTVNFQSTQFAPVEEAEKAQNIVSGFEDYTVEFTGTNEGDLLTLLAAESEAGEGTVDLVGGLHGMFPNLQRQDLLFDMTELLAELEAGGTEIAPAFVELGKLGTEDYQYYIPWAQATYIMAAHVDALEYLPEGADINALTWDQLAEWAQNAAEATGSNQLGFPVSDDGLWNRFMQGYIYPSYTGRMVTKFNSPEAVEMFQYLLDLWPYVNEQSVSYSFMQEPLLAGEVMIAFDHTARLLEAFNTEPENFVAFPAPAGPAGRGFMPVIAGLGVPFTADNPDGADATIAYLLSQEVQGQVLAELGFFPVVSGVEVEELPEGIQIEMDAVAAQANSEDALPALLPVGLGDRGGEINQIYRTAFNRIVLEGEDVATVLSEEAANLQALLDETGAACWPPDPASEGPCQLEEMAEE